MFGPRKPRFKLRGKTAGGEVQGKGVGWGVLLRVLLMLFHSVPICMFHRRIEIDILRKFIQNLSSNLQICSPIIIIFYYRVFIKYCVFSLKSIFFLNSSSSAPVLVFYLPGVCTHTDTEEKPRKTRVRNILKSLEKNTICNEHPVPNCL